MPPTTGAPPTHPATWAPHPWRTAAAASASSAPNGAAAATLLACGVGSAFFGLVVLLNDASLWLQARLTLSRAVGPLSGTAAVGVTGWLVAWAALHRALRDRHVSMARVVRATGILVAAAFVLTFPPFYRLFAAR